MKYTLVKTLTVIVALTLAVSLYSSNSNVVKLTEANFDKEVTNSNELWLVEFYAPWCGHCKNLAPEWEKAANVLKGIIKVGAVDMDVEKSFGSKFGITGFPTLKWFGLQKKNPKNYEGERNTKAIVDFAVNKVQQITKARLTGKAETGKAGESSGSSGSAGSAGSAGNKAGEGSKQKASTDKDVVVLTDANFDSLVFGSKDMWLIEFYAPWCGHCKTLEPQWNIAASELKGKLKLGKVDATANAKLGDRYGVKGYPTIKVFPPGEKKDSLVEDYNGGREAAQIVTSGLEKLEKFGYIPNVPQLTNPEMYSEECEKSGKTCIITFLPNLLDSTAEERNQYLDTVKKASTVGRGKPMIFLWAQGGDFFDYEEKFGLSFGYPAVLIVNHGKMKSTIMRSSFTLENVKTFLNRILLGREHFSDLPKNLSKIKHVSEWNGQDLNYGKSGDL
jgi:protein disulfide-isomerase A6